VTDTGRFMYENTGPRAHLHGRRAPGSRRRHHEIYRRLFEGVPQGKLDLLARGLSNVQRFDDGRVTVTELTLEDFARRVADESFSEGVIDYLRAIEGTAVATLVRERMTENEAGRFKVSLRARTIESTCP
jgi:phosphoesterase RecJ-like protein